MSGHGWVTPNADGMKARCGGPGMCSVCMAEQASVDAGKPRFKFDDETIDGVPKWLYFRCRSHNHYCKVALRPHRQQLLLHPTSQVRSSRRRSARLLFRPLPRKRRQKSSSRQSRMCCPKPLAVPHCGPRPTRAIPARPSRSASATPKAEVLHRTTRRPRSGTSALRRAELFRQPSASARFTKRGLASRRTSTPRAGIIWTPPRRAAPRRCTISPCSMPGVKVPLKVAPSGPVHVPPVAGSP